MDIYLIEKLVQSDYVPYGYTIDEHFAKKIVDTCQLTEKTDYLGNSYIPKVHVKKFRYTKVPFIKTLNNQ
jgi:hypothetical protein